MSEGGRVMAAQIDGEDMTEKDIREKLAALGQEHLFANWGSRPDQVKSRLMRDLASLDLSLVKELRSNLGEGSGAHAALPAEDQLAPAPFISRLESIADRRAREEGEECIRRGATAFLTVAGGQGSRLGFDGPKGMFPVTPIRRLSLFALFAEKLTAARRRYGVEIPWLIMTGPQNHEATIDYFEEQEWFGLGRDTVTLFMQGSIPSFSPDGLLLLGPDGGLLFNPNGHGGVVDGLRKSGTLDAMREQGVEDLFYFQVDNPLVRVPDPSFLGFHRRAGAQVSSKVVEKAYPEEKLGTIATVAGRPLVVEYSDLPPTLMRARAEGGKLLYPQGSIAIHIFDVSFLARRRSPASLARRTQAGPNPQPRGGGDRNCREGRGQDGDVRFRHNPALRGVPVLRDGARGGVRPSQEPGGGRLRRYVPARAGGAGGPLARRMRRRGSSRRRRPAASPYRDKPALCPGPRGPGRAEGNCEGSNR